MGGEATAAVEWGRLGVLRLYDGRETKQLWWKSRDFFFSVLFSGQRTKATARTRTWREELRVPQLPLSFSPLPELHSVFTVRYSSPLVYRKVFISTFPKRYIYIKKESTLVTVVWITSNKQEKKKKGKKASWHTFLVVWGSSGGRLGVVWRCLVSVDVYELRLCFSFTLRMLLRT